MKVPFSIIDGKGSAKASALIALLVGLALMAAINAPQRAQTATQRPD